LPYFVFPSSFFSIPFSGIAPGCSPGLVSPAGGAAGSVGAGADGAGAGGGGGGGAGSSFLPHPAKVSVKAKRDIPDHTTILFPIVGSPPFPSHISGKLFYCDFFIAQVAAGFKRFWAYFVVRLLT
jgi:hypothetical protein